MENKNKPLVKTGDENPVNRTSELKCKDCGNEINHFPCDGIHHETWECSNFQCGKEWDTLEEVEAGN